MAVNFIKDMYNLYMKANCILFFLTLTCFLSFGSSHIARAQESYPEFSFSALSEGTNTSPPQNNIQSNIVIKKPLMRDILILQDQINLLEGLIERQASIKQIAENYKNVGLPFIQPAPPQSICEKLPANLLCLNFYPDMPQNVAILDNFEPATPTMDLQNQMDALNNFDLGQGGEESVLNNTTDEISTARNYNWADIQCLGNRCTALVTSDNNFRMRVSEGDLLPDDARVSSISFSKVTIKDGDVSTDLQPLSASQKVGQSPISEVDPAQEIAQPQNINRPQSSGIRQLIDNNLTSDAPNMAPVESEDEIFAGQDSSSSGGLMSPTGLF